MRREAARGDKPVRACVRALVALEENGVGRRDGSRALPAHVRWALRRVAHAGGEAVRTRSGEGFDSVIRSVLYLEPTGGDYDAVVDFYRREDVLARAPHHGRVLARARGRWIERVRYGPGPGMGEPRGEGSNVCGGSSAPPPTP